MKLEFQAKYLQYLLNKNKSQGFTLLDLLIIIIIFGILAVIAFPSLLAQKSKTKQAEAINNIHTINRAQQNYFLKSQEFTTSITNLNVGINMNSENYTYTILVTQGDEQKLAQVTALANKPTLKSYIGIVGTAVEKTNTTEPMTIEFTCESEQHILSLAPTLSFSKNESGKIQRRCPEGYKIIPPN